MNAFKKYAIRKLPSRWLVPFAAILGLIRCGDDQIAGTSVGTENPDIVVLAFTRKGMPARMTGRLEIYSNRHNPLVDSLPLAVFAAAEEDTFRLAGDSLLAELVRSGKVRPGQDTTFSFNVLGLDANGEGGFLEGLMFEYQRDSIIAAPGSRQGTLGLTPLKDYRGFLEVQEKESISNYVAVFGTPYFTVIQNGAFVLKAAVPGKYSIHWVPYNKDVPSAGDSILAPVFSVKGILDTDIERKFEAGTIEDTIAFPKKGPRPAE